MLAALHHRAHRAAVVGAVEQEGCFRIAASPATKPERMPGTLLRLDRLVKATRLRKSCAPAPRRLQPAQRRLVAEVDLRVALVAGDHEAVAVAQLEQRAPLVQRHHRAGGVAGRADVQQLRARPGGVVDGRPSRRRSCAPGRCWRTRWRRRPAGPRPRRSGRTGWGRPRWRRAGWGRSRSAQRRTAPRACRSPAAPGWRGPAPRRSGAAPSRRRPRAAPVRRRWRGRPTGLGQRRTIASSTSAGVACLGSPMPRLMGWRRRAGRADDDRMPLVSSRQALEVPRRGVGVQAFSIDSSGFMRSTVGAPGSLTPPRAGPPAGPASSLWRDAPR
jgi:hypothetical protein